MYLVRNSGAFLRWLNPQLGSSAQSCTTTRLTSCQGLLDRKIKKININKLLLDQRNHIKIFISNFANKTM